MRRHAVILPVGVEVIRFGAGNLLGLEVELEYRHTSQISRAVTLQLVSQFHGFGFDLLCQDGRQPLVVTVAGPRIVLKVQLFQLIPIGQILCGSNDGP